MRENRWKRPISTKHAFTSKFAISVHNEVSRKLICEVIRIIKDWLTLKLFLTHLAHFWIVFIKWSLNWFKIQLIHFRINKEELGTIQKTSRALHTETSSHELHRYHYTTVTRFSQDSGKNGKAWKLIQLTVFLHEISLEFDYIIDLQFQSIPDCCCEAATYSCAVAGIHRVIDSQCLYVFLSVFNNFTKWLRSVAF